MHGTNIVAAQANAAQAALFSSTAQAEGDAASPARTLVLLGIDERGRPHASRFDDCDQDALHTAAVDMGFTVLPASSEALAGLASKLPDGKIFRSGRAFVPFVGQAMFDRLVAYLPISARPVKRASPNRVTSSAQSYEAADGDKPGAATDNSKPNDYAAIKAGSAKPKAGMFPDDWDKIRVGQIVLATADRDEGWWTAHVREDKGDGLFLLEWEEWEGFDQFLRRREQIALLHPAYDGK